MPFTTCPAGAFVVTGFFIFNSNWVKMSRKPSATQSRQTVPWTLMTDTLLIAKRATRTMDGDRVYQSRNVSVVT